MLQMRRMIIKIEEVEDGCIKKRADRRTDRIQENNAGTGKDKSRRIETTNRTDGKDNRTETTRTKSKGSAECIQERVKEGRKKHKNNRKANKGTHGNDSGIKIIDYSLSKKKEEIVAYFKVKSNQNIYEQRIVICDGLLADWSCTCPFGSAYRFAEKFLINDTKCKHAKLCIEALKGLKLLG